MQMHSLKGAPWTNSDNRMFLPPDGQDDDGVGVGDGVGDAVGDGVGDAVGDGVGDGVGDAELVPQRW